MTTKQDILTTVNKQRSLILQSEKNNSEVTRECNKSIERPVPQFARIITGIRRCGKSTFVSQDIKLNSRDAFYLNFDEPVLSDFNTSDFAILDEAIEEFRKNHNMTKDLYFDEIQIVENWETYVNSKLKEGFLVTVTGSNASLLSQELGTRLTGRHLDYEIFPFNFSEYCKFYKFKKNTEAFDKYLTEGGFPEFLQYRNNQILKQLFDDILFRDIIVRYGIKDSKSVRILAAYLCSNCGNLISGTKLSSQLGLKTTATILDYLSFLENSYLFSFVPKFDYSAKVQSVNPKKVYCIDTGMINTITLSSSKDKGRLFENAVFEKIRQETKNIWYYSESNFECDFLYSPSTTPQKAVQVCYELTNENREREIRGLALTCKKFPSLEGVIVTFNQKDTISFEGQKFKVISAVEFFK